MRLAIIHPFILAYEELDPINVVRTEIPGSEETLIQFSSELSRQGISVTVYTHLKERIITNDGVTWENIKLMRRESFYEVIISWSDLIDKLKPYLNLIPGSALKCFRLVNQQPEDSLRQVLNFFPIALSQTHWLSSRYSCLTEKNTVHLTNGLNIPELRKSETPKVSNRFVYASDYDRGLFYLLKLWPSILKACPTATLRVCYGWHVFDKKLSTTSLEHRQGLLELKDQINELFNQQGILHLGRIGHEAVNKELSAAQFWAYPCTFPENCSTLSLKAVALECLPIIIPSGGLHETVRYGLLTDGYLWSDTHTDSHLFAQELLRQWVDLIFVALQHGYDVHRRALQKEAKKCHVKYSYPRIAAKFLERVAKELV